MKLSAGERYTLTDEKSYITLTAGRAEVYAVTRQTASFRQIFLTELAVGEAAFPSMDEFGEIDVMVYAVEDAEFSVTPFAGSEPGILGRVDRALLRLHRAEARHDHTVGADLDAHGLPAHHQLLGKSPRRQRRHQQQGPEPCQNKFFHNGFLPCHFYTRIIMCAGGKNKGGTV